MRRAPTLISTAFAGVLLLRCGARSATPESGDASISDEAAASPTDASTAPSDAGACPARGTPVRGVAPVDVRVAGAPLLTAGRVAYFTMPLMSATGCEPRIIRAQLGVAAAPFEGICISHPYIKGSANSIALDLSTRRIAIGGAGLSSKGAVAIVSTDDPAWSVGEGLAQAAEIGSYPEADAGGSLAQFNGVTFVAGVPIFAAAADGAGSTITFRAAGSRRLVSASRREARVEQFRSIASAGDGGAWAAGVTARQTAALAKLTSTNELDVRAIAGGFIAVPSSGVADVAVGLDGQGRVVMALAHRDDAPGKEMRVVRLGPNGDLDTTYGAGGAVTLPLLGNGAGGNFLVVERGGGAIVGGIAPNPGGPVLHAAIVRVDANGKLDAGFGGGSPSRIAPGTSLTDRLRPSGVRLAAAPASGACEGEFFAIYLQYSSPDAATFDPHGYLFQ